MIYSKAVHLSYYIKFHMVTGISFFRWICLLLIITIINSNLSTAQTVDWQYKNLIDDNSACGDYPKLKKDALGNLHLTAWNCITDRLWYGFKAVNSNDWLFSIVNENQPGGYRSDIAFGANEQVYISWLANINNEAVPVIAKKVGNVFEQLNLDLNALGINSIGGYGPVYRSSTGQIQLSVSLHIMPNEVPVIAFYDETIINNQSTGRLKIIFADTIPKIIVPPIPPRRNNVPAIDVRFFPSPGEFCQILPLANGKIGVISVVRGDCNIILYRQPDIDTDTTWTYQIIDSLPRIEPDKANIRYYYTFEGLSASVLSDGSIAAFYTLSEFYGRFSLLFNNGGNFKGGNLFYARIFSEDSVRHQDLTPNRRSDRTFTSCAIQDDQRFFIIYNEKQTNQIQLATSTNGGNSWLHSKLATVPFPDSPNSLIIDKDSLVAVYFNSEKKSLIMATRSLTGTEWQYRNLLISNEYANALAGVGYANGQKRIAFSEPLSGKIETALVDNDGNISNRQVVITNTDIPNRYQTLKILGTDPLNPTIIFQDVKNNRLRAAIANGPNWNYSDIITTNQSSIQIGSQRDENRNINYVTLCNFSNKAIELKSRQGNTGNWQTFLIDQDTNLAANNLLGEYSDLVILNDGNVGISYTNRKTGALQYAHPLGPGVWGIEFIDSTAGQVFTWHQLLVGTDGLPRIAYIGNNPEQIKYAIRTEEGWKTEIIPMQLRYNLQGPIYLTIDSLENPWIAYATAGSEKNIRLFYYRKSDNFWFNFPVANNPNQISSPFYFSLENNSVLSIIGRRNRTGFEGIGYLSGLVPDFSKAPVDTNTIGNEKLLKTITSLKVWPNPFAENNINIEIEVFHSMPAATIQLINSAGTVCYQQTVDCNKNQKNHWQIALPHLAGGMYHLHITTGDLQATTKLVKIE